MVSALALTVGLVPLSYSLAEPAVMEYVNDFSSMDSLKDFETYWLPSTADPSSQPVAEEASVHWESVGDMIRRKGDISALGNISSLILKDQTFKNFEATLTYVDGDSWGWTVIGFRQQQKGTYFVLDGAGAYFDTAGEGWLWGRDSFQIRSDPAQTGGNRYPGYEKGRPVTMTVRVVGDSLKLYAGADSSGTPFMEGTLPDTIAQPGYLSVQVVGDNSALDNLKIKRLDDNGNVIPFNGSNVASVAAVNDVQVENGTAKEEVLNRLPGTVQVTDELGQDHSVQVSWNCGDYHADVTGDYIFTGTLTMPYENLTNADNVTATAKVTVKEDMVVESYVNDFSSAEALKDFHFHYLPNDQDITPEKEEASAHWTVENGAAKRVNDIHPSGATANISVMTLKDYTFKNFEATLTYQDGPANWGWTVLGFRQQVQGKWFILDGAGGFFDTAGQAWAWGRDNFQHTSGDYKIPGFVKGQNVTITVRVVGRNMKLYYGEGADKVLYLDKTLPDTVNGAGFLSIQVSGNDSSIDKLTVTRLDDEGNPAPLAQVKEVVSVETIPNVTVQGGTSKEDALAQLPGTVLVTDDLGNERACAVTWSCDAYDADTQGVYSCQGVLTMPDDNLINPDNLKAEAKLIVVKQDLVLESVGTVDALQVAYGTAKEAVTQLLPKKVSATDNLGNTYVVDVTWDSATYDGNASGVYAFTGTLAMPGGVVNSKGLTATAAVTVKEKPAPVADEYVNDFDSAEDLEDFDFYYAEGDTNVGAVKETAGAHWQLNADGTITRVNDVTTDGNYGGRSSIMVLKGYTFKNFEATLTYKYGSTWGWNVLGIRQEESGKDFRWNGAGAYMDQENTVRLWGQETLGGDLGNTNPVKADLPVGADGIVDKSQFITMKVRAVGNTVEIYANDKLARSFTCPDSFVREGFLSIQVTANDSVIDRFTVKRLDDEGHVIPMDTTKITEVETVANKVVPVGTSKEDALAALPGTVTVKDNAGQEHSVQVSWSCDSYNAGVKGVYVFTGTLTMPDTLLTNPDNLTAKATVTVGTEEDYKLKVESVPAVDGKKVANGTSKDAAVALLPESVEITDNAGGKHTLKVNWDCADYDGKLGGTYTFVGTLVLTDHLTNPDNKTAEARIEVEAYTMYVNDFNSMDDLKDFEAYFLAETNSPKKEDVSAHWTVENGVLKRVNDINAAGATSNISSLVLKDYQFKNFEATLTYTDGLTNWGWTVLGYRQQTPGNFFILDGAGSYIDVAGQAHLWGFASVAGPHDGGKMAGYVQGQPVTLKVRVVNQNMKIFAGDTLLLEKTLPEDFNYEGFLSLQVVGNDSGIDRLTIVRLDDNGNPLNLDGSKPQVKPGTNPGTGETTRVVIPALALAAISGAAAVFCTRKRRTER